MAFRMERAAHFMIKLVRLLVTFCLAAFLPEKYGTGFFIVQVSRG